MEGRTAVAACDPLRAALVTPSSSAARWKNRSLSQRLGAGWQPKPSSSVPRPQPVAAAAAAGGGASPRPAVGHAAAAPPHVQCPAPGSHNNILPIHELNEFRRGVGLCVFRPGDGRVFAARRCDDASGSWQMPQGGIDPLENPLRAALRELHEETGITSCRIVASIDRWLEYKFPTKVVAHAGDPRILNYRGQTQKWFLLEFLGTDAEIDITGCSHPEFSAYSWQQLADLPPHVVDFKQGVYRQVAHAFAPEIARRVAAASVV